MFGVGHRLIVLVGLMIIVASVFAQSLTTPQILLQTAKAVPACLRYKIVGQCLFINPATKKKKLTHEIAHYQPDVVVATYNQPGAIPWLEMRKKNKAALQLLIQQMSSKYPVGGGHASTQDGRTVVYFKEAAVYGGPVDLRKVISNKHLCARATQTGKTYFQSEVDAKAWRDNVAPAQHSPLLNRNIGVTHNWGNLFPLTGYSVSSKPAWATGLIAQRVAYITTGGKKRLARLAHRFTRIPASCFGWGCETFTVTENTPHTGLWQPLYPKASSACGTFGDGKIDQALSNGTSQTAMLNLWHCYRCCEPPPPGYVLVKKISPVKGCI